MLSGGAAASGGSATSKAAAGLSSLVSWVRHSVLAGSSKRELDEDEQQLRHVRQQGGTEGTRKGTGAKARGSPGKARRECELCRSFSGSSDHCTPSRLRLVYRCRNGFVYACLPTCLPTCLPDACLMRACVRPRICCATWSGCCS